MAVYCLYISRSICIVCISILSLLCRSWVRHSLPGCVHHTALSGMGGVQAALHSKKGQVGASACSGLGPTCSCHLGFRVGLEGAKLIIRSELWLLDLSPLQENYLYLREKLSEVCSRHGERVLDTPHNPISIGGYSAVCSAYRSCMVRWSNYCRGYSI